MDETFLLCQIFLNYGFKASRTSKQDRLYNGYTNILVLVNGWLVKQAHIKLNMHHAKAVSDENAKLLYLTSAYPDNGYILANLL